MLRLGLVLGFAVFAPVSSGFAGEPIADVTSIDAPEGVRPQPVRPTVGIRPPQSGVPGQLDSSAPPASVPAEGPRPGDETAIPIEKVAASRDDAPDDRQSSSAPVDGWTGLLNGDDAEAAEGAKPEDHQDDWTAEFR
ncbi:hypothetical protein [Iodidimonas sp. SYSU 1G8]|uniref:hypothetical protein n=1 Tax=Iodidimonas sp. SYSU 1G8 TaxID=3133967 RepID=UPI0031FEE8F2